jgi:hypothetical protein
MARKILESCPSCGGRLEITEVRCTQCETRVQARYRPCDFCGLSEEQSTFLRIFLTSRGNLSEVEKRLGVSYPTVRAKLDEVIARLGALEPEPQAASQPAPQPATQASDGSERRAILDAVARGEISAAEGVARIRALGGQS